MLGRKCTEMWFNWVKFFHALASIQYTICKADKSKIKILFEAVDPFI